MKKPNIVMIVADDMGFWSMGCMGCGDIKTPNLDALAKEGALFQNFFCASPVCSPARASIFTGKIPSQHGVHDWISKGHINFDELSQDMKDNFAKGDDMPPEYAWPKGQMTGDCAIRYIEDYLTYTDILKDSGYTCALSGKWHLGDAKSPQKGFTYWETSAMGGDNYFTPIMLQGDQFEMIRGQYITDYITDKALDFLNIKQENPFYLSVHYTAPHAPWGKEQHKEEFYNLYNDCEFTATPDVLHHKWAGGYTKQQRREFLQGYYAAVSAMDDGIGKVIARIKAMGEWENTIIMFTSDNGMSMGHHGIFGKGNGTFPMNMYDTAVKVPTIICYPTKIKAGTSMVGMYSHYDIMPTVAELMGVPLKNAESYPGTSFANAFDEGADAGREAVVIFDEYGPVRMIRTKEYKYVHRYPYGENELYDLINDPDEDENIIDNDGSKPIAARLKCQMECWYNHYVDPDKDGIKQEVYGKGQCNMVGKSGQGASAFVIPKK